MLPLLVLLFVNLAPRRTGLLESGGLLPWRNSSTLFSLFRLSLLFLNVAQYFRRRIHIIAHAREKLAACISTHSLLLVAILLLPSIISSSINSLGDFFFLIFFQFFSILF